MRTSGNYPTVSYRTPLEQSQPIRLIPGVLVNSPIAILLEVGEEISKKERKR